jgi:hypothetical protein
MSDGDDKLLRRYRELSRDEPPRALDAAILAASRRAVTARPWSQRLAAPVSIAAVLVLAIGVSVNMQREQPGVEIAEPQAPASAAAPQAQSAAEAPRESAALDATQADSLARKAAPPAAPKPGAAPALRSASPALKKEIPPTTPGPATPDATEARSAPLAAPEAVHAESRAFTPPPARAAAQAPLADSAAPALRASAAAALPDPAAELERIARLRGEGRHDEADKALEEFLRKHPDYRVPDPVWDRVKRR